MECILNPKACLTTAADTILGIFPYGSYGLTFTVGMIVGAILGKWGVAALIFLVGVLQFGSKIPEPHEHVSGHDAAPPVERPTIFKKRKKG